jgi:hypothetical protein
MNVTASTKDKLFAVKTFTPVLGIFLFFAPELPIDLFKCEKVGL